MCTLLLSFSTGMKVKRKKEPRILNTYTDLKKFIHD